MIKAPIPVEQVFAKNWEESEQRMPIVCLLNKVECKMETADIYPIGQQDFKMLRTGGALYVDKTRYIEKILRSKSQYYFLARPRRFGKSLFLSTLRYFFEGERDLFHGLAINSYGWEWERYPVLYLDLNSGDYSSPDNIDRWVGNILSKWEKKYSVEATGNDLSTRFYNVIEAANASTGLPIIILVDEYDKPLVHNLDNDSYEVCREKLSALYSNFKTCSEYIKLVFMTGVSRFSRLSVFSGLNNLKDITFQDEFADICGITEAEMHCCFRSGIQALADKLGGSYEEACLRLKQNYDGYRFAAEGSDIYNPWSLLNCLSSREILNFWNMTGIPTLIAKTLRKTDADIEEYLECQCSRDALYGLDLKNADPTALLYQTGYITIKDHDPEYDVFTLGIPNKEVKKGLFDVLLPYYSGKAECTVGRTIQKLVTSVRTGEPDKLMKSLQTYFAGIPYSLEMNNENNFQNAFYILTTLLGLEVGAEVQTSDGRIDMVLKSNRYIFVIELKFDGTAREALDQIKRKRYALQYADDGRKVYRIGVSFSSATRTVEEWAVE